MLLTEFFDLLHERQGPAKVADCRDVIVTVLATLHLRPTLRRLAAFQAGMPASVVSQPSDGIVYPPIPVRYGVANAAVFLRPDRVAAVSPLDHLELVQQVVQFL